MSPERPSIADLGVLDPGPDPAEVFACIDCGRMRSRKALRCAACAHRKAGENRERARLLVRQGFSVPEVAAHLGLAESTVRDAARKRHV